jgi:fucose permease
MSYYLPLVLINSVGLSNTKARLLTACNATSYFVFSCITVTMVERFGRRGLMLLSGFGQFLSFLVITILLRFAAENPVLGTASVAFFFLYHVAFGAGMLGVPWLYPTEINSLPMRTKGAAVATATNWCVSPEDEGCVL